MAQRSQSHDVAAKAAQVLVIEDSPADVGPIRESLNVREYVHKPIELVEFTRAVCGIVEKWGVR